MSEPRKSIQTRFSSFARRCLFWLACLATLLALFYAEEDWRGKHAWESYKRQSRAQGLELDWYAYVPPAAPDDQNFAMAPPFAGLFDYQYTTTNVHWGNTNIWARMGRLALGPGSVENKLKDWVYGRPVNLKEWQGWFRKDVEKWQGWLGRKKGLKVARSQSNNWPVPEQPGEPANDVLFALNKVAPDLAAIRAASERPQSRFPIHYDELPNAMLPHLGFLANISRVLQLRAVAELATGSNQPAFADATLAFYCADAIKSEPFMISQIIRCHMIEGDLQSVWEGLRENRWSKDQLEKFQHYFLQGDLLSQYDRGVKSDLAFTCGEIAFLPENPETFFALQQPPPFGASQDAFVWVMRMMPRGWFYENELTAAGFFHQTLLKDVTAQTQRVYPNMSKTNMALFEAVPPAAPYSFAFKAIGKGVVSPQSFVHTQTEINLALIACALERFRMAHGHFPEGLDALAPEFLEKLPHDIINGESLKYRLNEDGRFTLYSVGWNEKDDGETYPSREVSSSKQLRELSEYHPETGDWVWQYPAKQ
ncbi:MAG TPA: hypothetical protein VFC44_02265 [Candidatus Saccharimonadales bacterium]|nr:hypothetical protein [Candidatus Saccharimonadales bacterium]